MFRTRIRFIQISLCIAVGLLLASALPSNPLDIVFCPTPETVIAQQTWSQGSSVYTSDSELLSTLFLEENSIGKLGSRHLVCTYRVEDEQANARFHLRMQMPNNYSCTPSGNQAFVCRVRW